MARILTSLVLIAAAAAAAEPLDAPPPGRHWPLRSEVHEEAPGFAFGKPLVVTTYFYWYDAENGSHVRTEAGRDLLTTHPATLEGLSHNNPQWHKRQLLDMMEAGIDALLPVYWGVPGRQGQGRFGWSAAGMPPLVEAHRELTAEGRKPPRIGLFFDTSIFRYNDLRGFDKHVHVDLTTDFGKRYFYRSIRDYFSLVPPEMWARIEGKPIVFIWGHEHVRKQDPEALGYVRERFHDEFGAEPFIVANRGWQGDWDVLVRWRGSRPLLLERHVAAVGPGYDHSATNRPPKVVARRGGDEYDEAWARLLALRPESRPWLVHVETWNEWHEGTDVAHSREYGRQYIEATAKYAAMWRKGVRLEATGPHKEAQSVVWTPRSQAEGGLRLRTPQGDGLWETKEVAGRQAAAPADWEGGRSFLYFDVNDSFAYDVPGKAYVLEVEFHDNGGGFAVHYDSAEFDSGAVGGSFRSTERVGAGGEGWRAVEAPLVAARFANRANQADFRIVPAASGEGFAVSRLELRPVRTDPQ